MIKKIGIGLLLIGLGVLIFISFREDKKDANASIKVGDYEIKFTYFTDKDIYMVNYYDRIEDSNIYLHQAKDILIKKNEEEASLKDWLDKDNKILDEIINNLEISDRNKNGELVLYQDKCGKKICENMQVVKCKTKDGNKDIHIGQNLTNLDNICLKSDVTYTKSGTNKEMTLDIKGNEADTIRNIIYKYRDNYEVDNCDCIYLESLMIDGIKYETSNIEEELYFSYKKDDELVRFLIPKNEANTLREILSFN